MKGEKIMSQMSFMEQLRYQLFGGNQRVISEEEIEKNDLERLEKEFKVVNEALRQMIENQTKILENQVLDLSRNMDLGQSDVIPKIAAGVKKIFAYYPIRIVFLGTSKSGKSSIINRIRGIESNMIVPDKSVKVAKEGLGFTDTTKEVEECNFNKSKLVILDTPGHSGNKIISAEAYKVSIIDKLKYIDVVVFVFDGNLTSKDVKGIRQLLLSDNVKVIFVANKKDQFMRNNHNVSDAEKKKIIKEALEPILRDHGLGDRLAKIDLDHNLLLTEADPINQSIQNLREKLIQESENIIKARCNEITDRLIKVFMAERMKIMYEVVAADLKRSGYYRMQGWEYVNPALKEAQSELESIEVVSDTPVPVAAGAPSNNIAIKPSLSIEERQDSDIEFFLNPGNFKLRAERLREKGSTRFPHLPMKFLSGSWYNCLEQKLNSLREKKENKENKEEMLMIEKYRCREELQ